MSDAPAGRTSDGADTPGPAPAASSAHSPAARRAWRRWLLVCIVAGLLP